MNVMGGHAVVSGAGMAGLLAARELSELYDSVIVCLTTRATERVCRRGAMCTSFSNRGADALRSSGHAFHQGREEAYAGRTDRG